MTSHWPTKEVSCQNSSIVISQRLSERIIAREDGQDIADHDAHWR